MAVVLLYVRGSGTSQDKGSWISSCVPTGNVVVIQSTFEYELHIILINSAILLFLHVCLWAVTYHLLHSIRSRLFVIIYLVAVLGHFRWSEFFLSRLDIRERNILSRIVCRTSIIHWSISLISISFGLVFDKFIVVGSIDFGCHSFHIGSRAGSRDIRVEKKYICCFD